MRKTNSPKWVFTSRFRANAYSWKASKLACRRIKEAVSEIKKATRKDPVLGAEGSIRFMEKLWPALQHVDSSSGTLGTTVYNAMEVLVDVVIRNYWTCWNLRHIFPGITENMAFRRLLRWGRRGTRLSMPKPHAG